MANIRLVGNPTQVAEFAAYFEKILEIFLILTKDEPLSAVYQRSVLTIVSCLVATYANEVPNPAKRKEYLDKALKIAEAANSKTADVVYLKALTLRYQALYLFQQGDGKGAMQVWQKMNEMENSLFNSQEGKPTFGSHLSPERIEELSRALSTTEGTTEEVSQRLMSLSSNTMLTAFHKSRKRTGKFFEAVATGKYEKMRPRAQRGLVHELSDGMREASVGASKMGWNNIAADRRWWPENFNMHAFITKFDDADRRLDALEEAMDSGNTAQVRDHLVALMMRAHEHLEFDDLEEYVNALEELAQSDSVPELKEIDWKKQKDMLRASKVSIGLLSGKGTRKTVGKSKATLDRVAESIEDEIKLLKEQNGPPEMIATLEATVNGSRASRTAAKTDLEEAVQAAEEFLHLLKKENAPQEQIDAVEASIESFRADRDQLNVEQGANAESAEVLQNFSTAIHKTLKEDPSLLAQLQQSHFQLQQLTRNFDEAEAKDDYDLALKRLDAFDEFLEQPQNKIFKQGFNDGVFKKKRDALQFLQAIQPINEEFTDLLCSGKVEEARNLIQGFERSLSPDLRKAGEGTLTRLMKMTHEFPFR